MQGKRQQPSSRTTQNGSALNYPKEFNRLPRYHHAMNQNIRRHSLFARPRSSRLLPLLDEVFLDMLQ